MISINSASHYCCYGLFLLLMGMVLLPGQLEAQSLINLPAPSTQGTVSVEKALKNRRTIRRFANKALTQAQLSQLLWAAYGVTDSRGLKTAPSAGALYPLDIYVVVGERQVSDLASGVYHYLPEKQALQSRLSGDVRKTVARASIYQDWMAEAPVMIVITGEYRRSQIKYGQRGIMYTHMESGHAGQNLFLQAEALGLGAGIVGAFDNAAIIRTWSCHRPTIHCSLYQ